MSKFLHVISNSLMTMRKKLHLKILEQNIFQKLRLIHFCLPQPHLALIGSQQAGYSQKNNFEIKYLF